MSRLLSMLFALMIGLGIAVPAHAQQAAPKINEQVRGMVAAAVLGAMGERFGDVGVKLQIDALQPAGSTASAWQLQGQGRFQLDGEEAWEAFRFSCTYRPDIDGVEFPKVEFGGDQGPRLVLNDASLVHELETKIIDALKTLYPGSDARLQLDSIRSEQAGERFLSINAQGLADLGMLGTRTIHLQGDYDQRSGRWLRSTYRLDERLGSL